MIVLEKLQGTLRQKIVLWNDRSDHVGRLRFRNVRQRYPLCSGQLWKTRIKVLSDIADAMNYLHSQNILLRDLKTENCGFDVNGKIKIFDFGLAEKICESKKVGKDRYEFTVGGGTLRYMSPEAANGESIGRASDVYAFALLVWETMALEIPFEFMSTEEFAKQVLKRQRRPKLHSKWPRDLKVLLTKSWATDPEYRPSFRQILNQFERWCGKKNRAVYACDNQEVCNKRDSVSWLLHRSSSRILS